MFTSFRRDSDLDMVKIAMGMFKDITGMLSSETRGMVQRTWLCMEYKKLVLLSKTIDV